MAVMDPQMQRRLMATIREFGAACERMGAAAMEARLEAVELAAVMDKDLKASLEDAASAAIQTARGLPPSGGKR